MTPKEKEQIRGAFSTRSGRVRLGLRLTEDHRGELFRAFADGLQSLVPDMVVEKQDHQGALPGLKIGNHVLYHAIPRDRELGPFLDFLSGNQAAGSLPPSARASLGQVSTPGDVKVFIAAGCPHCPKTVTSMLTMARQCDRIQLTVVDGELFSELSQEFKIRSVPTVVLDDHYRWTGMVDIAEVIDMIARRDPVHLGKAAIQQLIEDGNAEGLAAMMMDRNQVFPAFMELLTHEKWPIRLGAMVVFEYLNDRADALALQVLERLWADFDARGDEIKGDILYLVGESGRTEFGERLQGVIGGAYGEVVREAAGEALAGMEITDNERKTE